jgi:HK97 family phage prohead protease
MTTTVERRYTSGTVELRAGDGGPVIGGYALKYNRLSQNLGGFVERVAPGALTKTLRDGGDVLARFQHADEFLLGRTSSGTLRLSPDDEGLGYDVNLPETDYARNLAALAERGDVRHSSFAFRTLDDEWGFTEQGFPMRTLLEIQLVDVAPVVNPAYLDTTSGLRSLAEARGLDLDELATAARAGRLGEVITSIPADGGEERHEDGPGETHPLVAIRRRRASLGPRPVC